MAGPAAPGLCGLQEEARYVDAYSFACVKLYGVISLTELVEIFNQESGGKTDLKEAEDYLKELADGQYYRVSEGRLLHALLPEEAAEDYIKARRACPVICPATRRCCSLARELLRRFPRAGAVPAGG